MSGLVVDRFPPRGLLAKARNEPDLIEAIGQRLMSLTETDGCRKFVIDCGNGAGSLVAPRLFPRIGVEPRYLFCESDGTFPNHHPDPSVPKNLRELIETVKGGKAELGIAFDGDGDRLGLVTKDGEIIFADRQLMLLAKDVLSRNPGAAQELDYSAVFRVKDGKVELLDKEVQPNGIAFTADEKTLYVGGGKIWKYDVKPDGTVANRKEFNPIGCDGMKLDKRGNIYCATASSHGVRIISPEGKHLGTIRAPEISTNVGFGDADKKTLYIAARTSIYKIRVNTPGI